MSFLPSLTRSVAISLAMSRGDLDCPNSSYFYMTGRPTMPALLLEYGPDKVGALPYPPVLKLKISQCIREPRGLD
uniref:Uncharacterized protein n=1 Tax=Utricularia reniformis TaxID=192314 RepID=A0A1Y0B310_9LAMI|nr:hypothetical protein AEK19_MT1591 [Utricularia reniformis]ART31774.1 hypothetical protein AEK19_MT1591 [Utricularia reniformis]